MKDPGFDVVILRNAHDRLVDCAPEKVIGYLAKGEFSFPNYHAMKKSQLADLANRYGYDTKTTETTDDGKTKRRETTADELAHELEKRDVALVKPFVPARSVIDDPKNKMLRMKLREAGLI